MCGQLTGCWRQCFLLWTSIEWQRGTSTCLVEELFFTVLSDINSHSFMALLFRQDCGFVGISSVQCQSRGCCWDSSIPNVPWCFHGPTRPSPFPNTPAAPTTQPPTKWDCTFEQGFCNWNNSKEDEFDWSRQRGSSLSIGTGPSSDHTTASQKGQHINQII